jgi:hypothetical protein
MSGVPNLMYHSAAPSNEKSSYTEYDSVEFVISNEGRSMQMGSVRVEGELAMTVEGELYGISNASDVKTVFLDMWSGAHGLCEQISVQAAGQMLETLSDYPRMVAAIVSGSQSQTDMFNSGNVCELKTPTLEVSREILMGEVLQADPNDPATRRNNPDFSFKPICVLNNTGGEMPYRQVGDIRLTLNLARMAEIAYGPGCAATNPSYVLQNLRCTWRSVPDDGQVVPITMIRHLSTRADIQSSQASIQMRVPAVCDSMFATFISRDSVGQQDDNTLALERPPGVSSIEFLFSDATNTLITYRLQDEVEILQRYIEALSTGSETSAATLRNVYSNAVWGVGLNFGTELDLNSRPLSLEITSEITNADAYQISAFFRSVLRL